MKRRTPKYRSAPTKEGGRRNRNRPIKCYVSGEDRAGIEQAADAAHMSLSGYLRTMGMNTPIEGSFDQPAVLGVVANAEPLNALGRDLRAWLDDGAASGVDPQALLAQISAVLARMSDAMTAALAAPKRVQVRLQRDE